MTSPPDAVPIPAAPEMPRRRSGVVQSSLDLVFSYSRSQQMRYGQTAGSAPSFINPSSRSQSSTSDYGSVRRRRNYSAEEDDLDEDEDILEEDADEGDGVDDQETPKGRSSDIPGMPDYGDEREFDDLEASVSTITPLKAARSGVSAYPAPGRTDGSRPTSVLGSSSSSRTYHPVGARLPPASSAGQRLDTGRKDISPTSFDAEEVANETTPLVPASQGARRRSSVAARRKSSVGTLQAGRRGSTRSRRKSMVVMEWGESTDGQTLFNGVAVLVGIGLLSLPLAFAYAGWIGGTVMLVGFAALTCHTAKLLARLIRADPTLRGYTDIGKKAFGGWAGGAINVLGFCLELFALGVALIVLFGDSLNVIYPDISADTCKIVGFLIVLPTALLPLSLLSLPSLLSTLSSLLLIVIILIDGFSKPTAPGSLRDPSPTHFSPEWTGSNWLGGIGLVLAGFGGHAVMPSLARDMKNPEHFDRVINRAFLILQAIATVLSFVAAAAGYLMIGQTVSDEITRDLMQPKYAYPRWLNLFALWMIVINPVTKFGLCSRPLNLTLETVLGIAEGAFRRPALAVIQEESAVLDSPAISPGEAPKPQSGSDDLVDPESDAEAKYHSAERKKFVARVISRTIVTGLCTVAAIYLPGFGRVMAFLGSFSAFLICIILPILFYLFLAPRLGIDSDHSPSKRRRSQVIHWGLVLVSAGLMVAGTTWAFIPGSGHGGLEE